MSPVCISRSFRMNVRLDPPAVQAEGQGLKIFCFAWTTWKPADLALLSEVRAAFKTCDGYSIFSDKQPSTKEEPDVIVVQVPHQTLSREDGSWLYHRNMVGLMPAWTHLLESTVDKYDWLVNVEFDHLLLTSKLRLSIATHLAILREGRQEQQHAAGGPLLLMFGNAFLFNQDMVREMKRQWPQLGATAPGGHQASGCPMFMEGRFEWPASCSQDIVYPNLVTLMTPPVPAYGSPGCGQRPQDFPLACFELQRQPVQELGLDQLQLVQELAKLEHSNQTELLATELMAAKDVPLWHHLSDPVARKMARELLGP